MSIDDALKSTEAAYRDWSDYLGNPNFCRNGTTITWNKREKIWLRNEFDYESYHRLIDMRQYSFVIAEDGGMIQLYYEFAQNGVDLKAASVGYYGASRETLIEDTALLEQTNDVSEGAEPNGDEGDAYVEVDVQEATQILDTEGAFLLGGQAALVPYIPQIRIDYSPNTSRPFVHEASHLHVPGFLTARIHVSGVPTPEQFVETVFAWFYPEIYEKRFSDSELGKDDFRKSRVDQHSKLWWNGLNVDLPAALPCMQFSHKP